MHYEIPKLFDSQSFALLKDAESADDQGQENSKMENYNDESDFRYN